MVLQRVFRAKLTAFVGAAFNLTREMAAVFAKAFSPPVRASVALNASVLDEAVLAPAALRALVFAAVVLTP